MKLLHWVSLGAVLLTSSASFGQALEAARFGISIDGQSASVIGFDGGEAPGAAAKATSTPLKVTVDRSGSDAMWQWIATSLNQGPVEKKIEGQAKGKRRATFTGATISEVKFDSFDANASKKPMRVTVTVVPKQIVAAGDAGKSKQEPAAKSWSPASFRVKVGGIPLAKVHKIESFTIKQKVTESGKAAYEVTDMRIKLDTADAKTFADALAKDKSAPLVIALTSDDDTVWRTLTVTGLKIHSTQASGAGGDIVIKGKNIAMN